MLPRISLPISSGNIEEWIALREQFGSSVYQKQTLSKTQKLNTLKKCLRGQAESLISFMQAMNSKYHKIWKILEERYYNIEKL